MLHSDGDAMDLAVAGGRIVGVRGRGEDRGYRGRLGPKDLFGWQAITSADRLTTPLVRRGGELVEAGWDAAMGAVVERSRRCWPSRERAPSRTTRPGSSSSRSTTRSAFLWKGGVGSNHLDGNTRLCTATAGEALKESFGADGQPGSYTDVDHCDVIARWGHNVARDPGTSCGSGCSTGAADRTPRGSSASTRATRRSRESGRASRAAARHEPRAAQRAAARVDRATRSTTLTQPVEPQSPLETSGSGSRSRRSAPAH